MTLETIMPALGTAGTIIFVLAYLPQIRHLWKVKDPSGISLASWITWALAAAMLITYAIYIQDFVFILLTTLEFTFLVTVIGLVIKYRRPNSDTARTNTKLTKGIRLGIYRHYKGSEVEVTGSALHSETLEEFVLYRHLTGEHAGETHFWVRPRGMFLEEVEIDGKKVPRFEYLRDNA